MRVPNPRRMSGWDSHPSLLVLVHLFALRGTLHHARSLSSRIS